MGMIRFKFDSGEMWETSLESFRARAGHFMRLARKELTWYYRWFPECCGETVTCKIYIDRCYKGSINYVPKYRYYSYHWWIAVDDADDVYEDRNHHQCLVMKMKG